jgi:hypothetical protein
MGPGRNPWASLKGERMKINIGEKTFKDLVGMIALSEKRTFKLEDIIRIKGYVSGPPVEILDA